MSQFQQHIICLAEAFVPELRGNSTLQAEFWESFTHFFKDLDEDSASKLKLLPKVLNVLTFLRSFKTLAGHAPEKRETILIKLGDFPVSKIVAGMTGIRSLIFVAFYSMPETWKFVHYDGPIVNRSVE